MSGAQAAVVAAGCCCQHQDDGGPPPPPVSCSDSSPGAVSDRATTAIALFIDLQASEAYRIDSGRNCVSNTCTTTDGFGDPVRPYSCGPSGGICWGQEGRTNTGFPVGHPCFCRLIGNCETCQEETYSGQGGSAIALQTSPGDRRWQTYQIASLQLPDHRFAEWTWRPEFIGTVNYTSNGVSHSVRKWCPWPGFRGNASEFTPSGAGNIYSSGGVLQVTGDPTGHFVNATSPFAYTASRWGSMDVGRCHVVIDARIEYRSSYISFGAGWLAQISLYYVFTEDHIRARNVATRWVMGQLLPDIAPGYPPLFIGQLARITGLPFFLWKPCVSGNDTVRGAYQPISVTGSSPVRSYFEPVNPNCPLSGQRTGGAEMRGLIVT